MYEPRTSLNIYNLEAAVEEEGLGAVDAVAFQVMPVPSVYKVFVPAL